MTNPATPGGVRQHPTTPRGTHPMTWIRNLRAAVARDTPAFNPSTQKPVVPAALQEDNR